MSPLWSDLALARAALADAVERGLVKETPGDSKPNKPLPLMKAVRRIPRRRIATFAL